MRLTDCVLQTMDHFGTQTFSPPESVWDYMATR